jgi:hypothetical protein
VVTLVWLGRALAGKPEYQLLGVLGGTAVRLFVVAGATLALYMGVPSYRGWSFLVAVLVFYLFTLGLELALVVPAALAAATAGGTTAGTTATQGEPKIEERGARHGAS